MPIHNHEGADWFWVVSQNFNSGNQSIPEATNGNAGTYADQKSRQKWYTENAGSGQYHNNISPSLSAYIWRRTV